MGVEIEVERIKMYKIKAFDALRCAELPKEYTNGIPCVYLNKYGNGLTLIHHVNDQVEYEFINVDSVYTKSEFGIIQKKIKIAKSRLDRINHTKHEKATENEDHIKDWDGTYIFKV